MYYERYFTRASYWLDVSVVFSDALVRGSDHFYLEGFLFRFLRVLVCIMGKPGTLFSLRV